MKHLLTLLILFSLNAQAQNKNKEPVAVILDTDIGPDYDDVGAMAVLHALADKGEARILAIMASNKNQLVGPTIDVLNTYFGRPNLPIGGPKNAGAPDMNAVQQWPEMLVKKYPHRIQATSDVPDAVGLYRKLLAAEPDRSVTIITVGFLTNLAILLESTGDEHSPLAGRELVRQKVKHLVSMAGTFPKGREFNIYIDSLASEKTFPKWPTPILFSGFEIGKQIKTGRQLISNDLLDSPVKAAFAQAMAFSEKDREGRMSWDQTAVLVGVRGAAPYFGVKKGNIILKGGYNEWDDDPNSKHSHLVPAMPFEKVREIIEALMMHTGKKKL